MKTFKGLCVGGPYAGRMNEHNEAKGSFPSLIQEGGKFPEVTYTEYYHFTLAHVGEFWIPSTIKSIDAPEYIIRSLLEGYTPWSYRKIG